MEKTVARVKVMNCSQLPERIGQAVQAGEECIAIFKTTSGNVYAIENKSPHPKGGVLSEGLVSGEYVFCPVYDLKISLSDGKVQAPDVGQVKTYKVEMEDNEIFVLI